MSNSPVITKAEILSRAALSLNNAIEQTKVEWSHCPEESEHFAAQIAQLKEKYDAVMDMYRRERRTA